MTIQIYSVFCLEIIICQHLAIFARLFSNNDQSRTCFLGCLCDRSCTQWFQGVSQHLDWEALLSEPVLVICPYLIEWKFFHLGEAAVYQAVGIPEEIPHYIIHSLPMLSHCRLGHAAFLITPTEVILLWAMLSFYVPKPTYSMCAMCTRASPSTDLILL